METLPQPVDYLTSSMIFLPLLVRVLRLGVQASQGEMSLPELRRVANDLGERQRLPQPALSFVSLLAGEGDLSLQPPTFNQVFPCICTCGTLQTLHDVLLCLGEVAAGKPEIAQAGEEVQGVALLHPVTRGRIVCQTVDLVEVFLGQHEVTLH